MLRRKLIISILFVFTLFFSATNTATAQETFDVSAQGVGVGDVTVGVDRLIPFYNCGIAGFEGRDACCYFAPFEIDENPSLIDKIKDKFTDYIPVYGNIKRGYRKLLTTISNLQGDYGGKGPCIYGAADPLHSDPKDDQCVCFTEDQAVELRGLINIINMCKSYYDPVRANGDSDEVLRLANEQASCIECASVDKGYYSGFGCIQLTSFTGFVTKYIFGLGISVAGIIALLCIIISAMQIQTSAGNAEKLQKARERMTACILGLLLIIFSVFILQLAGAIAVPGL